MNPSIARLAGRTLLLLPLCFLAWYFTAAQQAGLVREALQFAVNATFPIPVPVVQKGGVLELILEVPAALSRQGGDGQIQATITLDILMYGCGMPLFVALMLATPGGWRRWQSLLKGLGLLVAYTFVALYVSTCYNT